MTNAAALAGPPPAGDLPAIVAAPPASVAPRAVRRRPPVVPPLENGDRLTADEFERRWDAMPDVKRAELIQGIVHMPPPVSHDSHSLPHANFAFPFLLYRAATPGLTGGDNGSLRLGPRNMPQADLYLMRLHAHGGQARIVDGYVVGGPELVAEVAASSASHDLHAKRRVYRRAGVREYVVWRTYDVDLDYFVLRDGRYHRLPADPAGIYRSDVFPGLWLDGPRLLAGDLAGVQRTLNLGLASPEHAAYVARLGGQAG